MQTYANCQGRVYVIGDSIDAINIIPSILKDAGYDIVIQNSRSAALQQFPLETPDLILIDYRHDRGDNYDICRQIKSDEATFDVPVIFFVETTKSFDKVRAFNSGAVDYIPNPIVPEELLTCVSTQISFYRLKKELQSRDQSVEKMMLSRIEQLRMDNTELRRQIDVSEKEVDELRQKESLHLKLLNHSPIGFYVVDKNGKLIFSNKKFVEMWSIPEDVVRLASENRVLEFMLSRLHNPEPSREKFKDLEQHSETRIKDEVELLSGLAIKRSSAPFLNAEGEYVGRIWKFEDITEDKFIEHALRRVDGKYRDIFINALEAIVLINTDGTFIDVNPAFTSMLGYDSREEFLSCNIRLFDDLFVLMEDISSIRGAIAEKGFVRWKKVQIYRKNKSKIWISVDMRAMRDARGMILYYEGFAQDLTEHEILQNELIEAQKMDSLGTLAGGIAHDFNNLLGIILGHMFMLEKCKNNPQKYTRSLEAINKTTQRGIGLVKQLLTFARKSETILESIQINEIVCEVVGLIAETFPKTIVISPQLGKNLPSIVGDANQIHQVILNLCVNARDAMPMGGLLVLGTELIQSETLKQKHSKAVAEEYVCLRVSDSGKGMDETTLKRIFEPFFTTKELGKGTGLGLSVVYGIVDNHKGFIDVTSEIGYGSTFQIYFPTQSNITLPQSAEDIILTESIRGGSETILVVEDEEMLREFVMETLANQGYNVIPASDGEMAVELYTRYQSSIALTFADIGLPLIGGVEVLTRIRSINPSAKIVFGSGYVESQAKNEMLEKGAWAILNKPYKAVEILKVVREAIDDRK